MNFEFTIEERTGRRNYRCEMKGAVICGYTGRNVSLVRKHIEELEKAGIEPPPSVPMFYPKPDWGLCLDGVICVPGVKTSGEIEFVLLVDGDNIYVGAGSDHTDRELEKQNVLQSKQLCPSVLSRSLWNYTDIKDHWDLVEFRSWAIVGDRTILYQESNLACITEPHILLDLVRRRVIGSLDGIAIFSGTSSLLTNEFIFADRFEGELFDPVLHRRIRIGYDVRTMTWFAR